MLDIWWSMRLLCIYYMIYIFGGLLKWTTLACINKSSPMYISCSTFIEIWPRVILETIGHRPKCQIQKLFILIPPTFDTSSDSLRLFISEIWPNHVFDISVTYDLDRWPKMRTPHPTCMWSFRTIGSKLWCVEQDQDCGQSHRLTDTQTTWTL